MKLIAFALTATGCALSASPAAAVCTASNQYNFLFSNQTAGTLAYGTTYNYTASTPGAATRPFTMLITQNGLSVTTVNGTQLPAITNLITGPTATLNDLDLGGTFAGRTADISTGTRAVTVTFTFAQPIRDFAMSVHDVDFTTNQYRDWLMVSGVGNGVTYTPSLTTPWGNNNGAGSRTATSSSVTLGPNSTPITLTASQAVGSGASGNNSDDGTVTATFAQPVTVVTVRYGNAPLGSGESATGQQGMGIQGIAFCPMPVVAIAKTSAPIAGTLGTFNLPGSDVTYTFTVTNTGGSPVDAGSIVLTDALPANVTFRNTVLDAASGLPFALNAGSSGVTITSGSASYSKDGGATWSYAPASGYDPVANAVRVTPTGAMAANASFTISFVARIK